jgi:hypothetical protein
MPTHTGGPGHTSKNSKKYMPLKTISLQMSHDIGIRFLDPFQDNKALGEDALKFAKEFHMSVEHNDATTVVTNEDFFPIGQILDLYGQTIKDVKSTEDALDAVRHVCALNREEHGYAEKPENVDEKFPIFNRFWFVMGQGKISLHTQEVQKKLEQHVDLKNLAQLEAAKLFMEGMGFSDKVPESSMQVENAKATDVKKSVQLLRCSYLGWIILRNA